MVKPAQRRECVGHLRATYGVSARRACQVVKLSRKAVRAPDKSQKDLALSARLKQLGEQYPRYGYLMLHALLAREDLVVNKKRTYRLYKQMGMQVRTKRRRKLIRPRVPLAVPTQQGQRWSLDFVHDQLVNGRRMRVLNVVDDYSRRCVGQLVDTSISGARMARFLDQLGGEFGMPRTIVMDNGTEMTSKAMFFWSQQTGTKLHFIQPGKPTQNAFVESFNGKFRDSCLNQHWFINLDDARRTIDVWRHHYNNERPHSSLGYLTPSDFERKAA